MLFQTAFLCVKSRKFILLHDACLTHAFFKSWSPVFCGIHHIWREIFPTSWLSSALSSSSFWVHQRAGIHNPLGHSDWKLRTTEWVPKSYKECNREYIYYSDYILMLLVCQHKNDPEISYLRISQVMLSKSGWKKRKGPVLNHVLNSLTSGEMTIRGTDLAKAWRLLFDHTSDKLTMLRQKRKICPPPF